MSYIQLMKNIKNKDIPRTILLYGNEPFFIQNIQQTLIDVVLKGAKENLSTYDLEETPIEVVIEDAETYPFFGEHKLIFAHHPTFLSTSPVKLPFEHQVERLEQYLQNPVDYTVIVLVAPYEKLDGRKKITKTLKKHASTAACHPIKDHEISKWINQFAKDFNISITGHAMKILETELITNLYIIHKEVEKLALFVGENGQVTGEVAEALISFTLDGSALRLVDAVMNKDLLQAMHIYKSLEKMNEEPIALIALLAFQFRTIYQVKLLKQKGYSTFQLRKQINAHPYVIKIASEREVHFTTERLAHFLNVLAETDASIKTGDVEKSLAFELLLYQLIQK